MTTKTTCNVPANLKVWLEQALAPCGIENRVHYLVAPQIRQHGGICYIDKPYLWFSRNGIENEDCLDTFANREVLALFGQQADYGNDTESFDIEIWGEDAIEVEAYARTLVESVPYHGWMGDIWTSGITLTDQDDNYFHRGINESYEKGGATAASFVLDVCPRCNKRQSNTTNTKV